METSLRRPTQAVILAGGRGTRLRPLTDTLPKPMIPFHGKPFLDYLLEMLAAQGFRDVLLLLGYLPHLVTEHVGDGRRWGLRITSRVSDVDDDTGRRVALARDLIEDPFLLMYCDNYWPMRFDAMWRQFAASGAKGMITVYANEDRYTRDNVRVGPGGWVETYDKTRTAQGLQGVDLGFMVFRRDVLDLLPEGNVSFEKEVLPRLVERQQLQAFVTQHRYYSVGSHERLPLTTEFLARKRTILLDRDGVLNERMPKAQYVTRWSEWRWRPGAREALRLLRDAGYRVVLISNQPGIARGALSEGDLADIHERMRAEAEAEGGRIDAIYVCPHNWDEGCPCRKPRPGMLFQAQRDLHLDLSRTWFIGDDERDGQAGEAAGCPWELVTEQRGLLDVVTHLLADRQKGP